MRLTIDNSVAIKWIVDELGSEQARSYLPTVKGDNVFRVHLLTAPVFIEIEMHNILSEKYRNGEISRFQFNHGKLLALNEVRIDSIDQALAREAADYAVGGYVWRAAHTKNKLIKATPKYFIYDCIYIAHARQNRNTLLTADKEQAEVAEAIGIPVEFVQTK